MLISAIPIVFDGTVFFHLNFLVLYNVFALFVQNLLLYLIEIISFMGKFSMQDENTTVSLIIKSLRT